MFLRLRPVFIPWSFDVVDDGADASGDVHGSVNERNDDARMRRKVELAAVAVAAVAAVTVLL